MYNKETEYFCFNHGKSFAKEEISCPDCCNELAGEHDDHLKMEWFEAAANYFYKLGVFSKQENLKVYEIIETIWEGTGNKASPFSDWICPKEAVKEEMSYWG